LTPYQLTGRSLVNFLSFTRCLNHQLVQKSADLFFPLENMQRKGAYCKCVFVFFVESQGAAAWSSQVIPCATSCSLWRPRRILWRPPQRRRLSLPPSLSFWSSFFFFLSLHAYSSRRSPPSATVRHCPELPRCAEKVRIAVLYFPTEGIEPPCPESPSPSRIPRRT
jgi:hypothetical protein